VTAIEDRGWHELDLFLYHFLLHRLKEVGVGLREVGLVSCPVLFFAAFDFIQIDVQVADDFFTACS